MPKSRTPAPQPHQTDWTKYYGDMKGLVAGLPPQQQKHFADLASVAEKPQEATMRAINQAYVEKNLPDLPSGAITHNWEAVRKTVAKESFGVEGEVSEEKLRSLIAEQVMPKPAPAAGADGKPPAPKPWSTEKPYDMNDPVAYLRDDARALGLKSFSQRFNENALQVHQNLATSVLGDLPDAPINDLPDVWVAGPQGIPFNPKFSGIVWNTIKTAILGLTTPYSLITMPAAAELKALSATSKLAHATLTGMGGGFTWLMLHAAKHDREQMDKILADSKTTTADKAVAVGKLVISAFMAATAAVGTAFEALGEPKAKVVAGQVKAAQEMHEAVVAGTKTMKERNDALRDKFAAQMKLSEIMKKEADKAEAGAEPGKAAEIRKAAEMLAPETPAVAIKVNRNNAKSLFRKATGEITWDDVDAVAFHFGEDAGSDVTLTPDGDALRYADPESARQTGNNTKGSTTSTVHADFVNWLLSDKALNPDIEADTLVVIRKMRKALGLIDQERPQTGAPEAPKATGPEVQDFLSQHALDARARILERMKHGRTNMGFGPDDIADAMILVAHYMDLGHTKLNELTDKLVADLGDSVRPFLNDIYIRSGVTSEAQQKAEAHAGTEVATRRAKSGASEGLYVGSPGITSPQQLTGMRRLIQLATKAGTAGRFWYEESSKAILEVVGGDKVLADKLAQMIGIFSPQTPVATNWDYAMRAFLQWRGGMTEEQFHANYDRAGMYPTDMAARAADLLYRNEDWEGRKTNNFYNNLMTLINPSRVQGVTADMWIARLFNYDNDVIPDGPRYQFVQNEFKRIADEIGWKPHQVQAAAWTYAKTIWEDMKGEVKAKATKKGITEHKMENEEYDALYRKMFQKKIRADLNAPGGPTVIADNAVFNFSHALKSKPIYLSWEAVPSIESGAFEKIHSLPIEDKILATKEMMEAGNDPVTGKDIIGEVLTFSQNAPTGEPQVSSYENAEGKMEHNPAVMTSFYSPSGKGGESSLRLDPAGLRFAQDYARLKALYFTQNSVGGFRPFESATVKDSNAVYINLGRPVTVDEMTAITKGLEGKGVIVPFPDTNGVKFIRIDIDEGNPLESHNRLERAVLEDQAGEKLEAQSKAEEKENGKTDEVARLKAEADKAYARAKAIRDPYRQLNLEFHKNLASVLDSIKFSDDEMELEKFNATTLLERANGELSSGPARSSDLLRQLDLRLSPRIEAVHQEWVNRGWGKAPERTRFGPKPEAVAEPTRTLADHAVSARERIVARMKSGKTNAGIDPADMRDYAIIVADYMSRGLKAGADLASRMVSDFGEQIRPHLDEIYMLAYQIGQKAKDVNPSEVAAEDAARIPSGKGETFGETLSKGVELGAANQTLGKAADALKGGAAKAKEIWDYFRDIPKVDGFRSIVLEWVGNQGLDAQRLVPFLKEIKRIAPKRTTRQAIANWLDAGGDRDKLAARAAATTDNELKKGYENALKLQPNELELAQRIKQWFDDQFERALQAGIIKDEQFREDYVTHMVDKPYVGGGVKSEFMGKLNKNFQYNQERTFPDFHQLEQAGFRVKTKDIGEIIAGYDAALSKSINTRRMVDRMMKEPAADGQPLAYRGTPPEGVETTYEPLSHPTLRGTVFHPDVASHLRNILGRSAFKEWYDQPGSPINLLGKRSFKFVDQANRGFANTMLSGISTFHLVHEMKRGLGYGINVFNLKKINAADPMVAKALRSGLIVGGNREAMSMFTEGTGSHRSLTDYVPVLGDLNKKVADLTFHEVIPRLKYSTWLALRERNLSFLADEIKAGTISEAQVEYLSSSQANARFGELNYADLGRNPTLQHVAQMLLLAPDFLESNWRNYAQAAAGLTGAASGREAAKGLILTAGVLWLTFRAINSALNDDHNPHFEEPFGVVDSKHHRILTMRNEAEDVWRFYKGLRSTFKDGGRNTYVAGRTSPFAGTFIDLLSGSNWRGEKSTAWESTRDLMVKWVPMSFKWLPGVKQTVQAISPTEHDSQISLWQQFLATQGLQVGRKSTIGDAYKLAADWKANLPDTDPRHEKRHGAVEPQSKYVQVRYALEDQNRERLKEEIRKLNPKTAEDYKKLDHGMRESLLHAYTGSKKDDEEFFRSLPIDDQVTVAQADFQRHAMIGMLQKYLQLDAREHGVADFEPRFVSEDYSPRPGTKRDIKTTYR